MSSEDWEKMKATMREILEITRGCARTQEDIIADIATVHRRISANEKEMSLLWEELEKLKSQKKEIEK